MVFAKAFGQNQTNSIQTDSLQLNWEPTYFEQFELRQDNDFLHFTDRYYLTGSFLGLHRWLTLSPE